MTDIDFANEAFLDKEAALNFNAGEMFGRLKGVKNIFRGAPKTEGPAAPPAGKFVHNADEQAGVNAENSRFYEPDEIHAKRRQEINHEGTGGILPDMVSGLINRITPRSWDVKQKTEDALYKMKSGLTNIDTKAGSFLGGDNVSSVRGKVFSVPVGQKGRGIQVGEKTNPDGSVTPLFEGSGGIDRRPSLIGPVQNSVHMASPFLAATYVADKLYPRDHNPQNSEEQVAFSAEDYFAKIAEKSHTTEEENGILLNERMAWDMEKEASFQKIAQLEDELEKTAAALQGVLEENKLLNKQAGYEREAKQKVEGHLKTARDQLIEKKAEFEEFRLRTVARERSQVAVKLAEEMLEKGLVKQAQLESQIDRLMECDEPTFNLFASMVKQASIGEEGLESLAVLGDYSSNDLDSTSLRPIRGVSKSGQTIGEAARDVLKK